MPYTIIVESINNRGINLDSVLYATQGTHRMVLQNKTGQGAKTLVI